jgi:adenylosuccinate synthase
VLARLAARVNGMWALALTKLDVLTGIDPLKLCVAYQYKGKRYETMPPGRHSMETAKPIFEEMPGWNEKIGSARSLGELPANARRYIERIGELTGVSIAIVSVGPERTATIVLNNPFA